MPQLQVSTDNPSHTRRVELVRFSSLAGLNEPHVDRPPVDDRGFGYWPGGPILTMTAGQSVRVRLQRVLLDNAARINLASSGSVEIEDPPATTPDAASGCAGEPDYHPVTRNGDLEIVLQAPAAQDYFTVAQASGRISERDPFAAQPFQYSRIDVRWRNFVIHSLHVFVFRPMRIRLSLWRVNVVARLPDHPQGIDSMNVPAIRDQVNAIWSQAGIAFEVDELRRIQIERGNLAEGSSFWGADSREVFQRGGLTPGAINIYFLWYENSLRRTSDIGYTYRPGDSRVTQPNIIIPTAFADASATSIWVARDESLDTYGAHDVGGGQIEHPLRGRVNISVETKMALTVAHEIGHYFDLAHPHDEEVEVKPWVTYPGVFKLLMCNNNPSGYLIPLCKRRDAPAFNDNGCFEARRAASDIRNPYPSDAQERQNLSRQREQAVSAARQRAMECMRGA